jgi:hypothetical protein
LEVTAKSSPTFGENPDYRFGPFTHPKARGQYYHHHKDAKIRNTRECDLMLVQNKTKKKKTA